MRLGDHLSGVLAAAAVLFFLPTAFAQTRAPGPEGEPSGPQREQVWWVPVAMSPETPGQIAHLETTVYRPPGDGPFPLIILSHGTIRGAGDRLRGPRFRYVEQSQWLVSQGFAVAVPMRRGYAHSDGIFSDGVGRGGCNNPDYVRASQSAASDILGAAAYFSQQNFIDGKRIVLVGHSSGGSGSLAAAARNPNGVIGVVNFAGGLGSLQPDTVCAPDRLVAAFTGFGKTARIPSIWLYAENDRFFSHIVKRVFDAYTSGGAPAEFVQMPAYGSDGHTTFLHWEASNRWVPQVGKFLNDLPARSNR
jgi:dienelactone hydrolase